MIPARLHLLGGFRLTTGQGHAIEVTAKKNRALIAILALAPRRETTRDRLAGLLWSDRGEVQARSSLRQALVALRKDLSGLDADPLVLNGDHVGLAPELLAIDVIEFLVAAASADPAGLQRAAALYAGPLLDGLNVADNGFDDWLREARSDLASQAMKVLTALAETLVGGDRVAAAEKLVALDPLREASHAVLMEAHIAQGQTVLAIRQYENCKQILKRELNVEPGASLRKLRRSLDMENSNPGISVQRDRKPIIAVLPFENLSGDPGQQYFSDGMTEDITDRLSKYRILSVIGRYSSFAMRGRDAEMREIRDKLSADYVLTGNIRKSDSRIRVAARLTDARAENVMWADHYDRPLQDIFAVQDEVANIIASTLMGRVEFEFGSHSLAPSPAGISSYEHVLQGMWHFNKLTREANADAASCFEKAIASYPQNGEAHRWLSACHISSWLFDFSPTDMSNCLREAVRAVELDPASARCHTALGLCQLWLEGVEAAAPSYQRAFTLNPGDPNVLIELGLLNAYAGNLAKSNEFFDQVLRLLPLPPLWFADFRGVAEFSEGRYTQALPSFMAFPEAAAWDTMYAMACLGHLGKHEQAFACKARFQADGRTWDLLKAARMEPFIDRDPRERLIAGLEKALAL